MAAPATGSTRSHLKTFTLAILLLFLLSTLLIPVVSAHQLPGNLHQPADGPEGHARGYGHSLGHGLVGRKHGAADKRMMRRVRGKGKDGLEKVIRDEQGPEFGLLKKGSESKRDESQDLAGFAEGLLNAAVAVNVSVGDVTSVTPESTSPIDGFTATEVITTEPTFVTQEQPTSTVETVSTTSETAATASETVTQTQEPTASSSSNDASVPPPSESATATAPSVSAVAAPSDSAVAPPPGDSAETSTTSQQEAAPTTSAVTSSTAAEVIPDVASTTGTDMAAEAPSSAGTTAEAVPTAIVPESSASSTFENVPQSQALTMSGPIASSVPPTEEPATVDSASVLAPTNTAAEVNTQPTLESMQPSVQTVTPETTPTQEGGITSTQATSETIVPPVIAPTTTEETISLPAETSIALATTTSEQPVANPSGSVVESVPTQTAQVNSQTSDSFVTESQIASTVTQPADVGPTVTIEPSSSIPSASVSASSVETIAAPVQSATDVANTSETFLATETQQSAIPTTAQGSVPDAGGSTIVANPSASGTGPDGLATVIPSTTADSANTAGPTGSFDPATTTSTIGPVQNSASTSTLLGAVSSVTEDMTGQLVTSTQGTASGPVPSEVGSSQTSQLSEQTTRVETSIAADPTFGVAPASSSTNGSSAIPTEVQATSTVESSSFGPVMTTSIQESVSSGTLPVATSEASFGPVTTSVTSDSQATSSVAITSQGSAESALTTDATSVRLSETAAEPTRTSASSVISPSGNSSITGEIETSTRPTGTEPNESIATGSATSLVSGTAEFTAQSDSWTSWESSQSTAAATSSSFQPYVPTATTLIFAAPTSTTSASSSTASATRTQATEQSLTLTPETTLVMPSTAVIASNVPTMIVPPSEPTTTTKAATETATASEDGSQTTAGSALISILLNSNNYPWQFVVNNSDATSQLFVTFPEMLSTALAIDSKEVRTYALQAYSPASYNGDGTELLTKWLGYIPADRVNDLAQYIKTPSSPLYNQAGIPGQLALQIDSSYPLVGSTNTGSNGSPTSAASVSKTDNTRRDTIIGVCVGVGGALWLALAVWIYRRVKRNHDAKIHRRLSERFSVNDGAAFAGTYPANYRHSRSSSLAASEVDDRPSSFYANDADNFPAARRRRSSVSQAVRESVTFGNQSHRPPSGIGSSWFRSSGSQSNRRISRDFGANNPTSPPMSQNPFADIVHRSYLENGPAPRSPAWRTSTNGRPVDKRLIGAPTLQSNSLEFTGYK